jgi:hypothetical protein
MGKHTDGPWEVMTHYGGQRLMDESSVLPFSIVKPVSGSWPEETICEVWGGEHDDIANAQLISEAPALLEACKELIVAMIQLGKEHHREVANAQAVIGKAQGIR